MCSASFSRRLSEYPEIFMEIGSPNGATCSRYILSPGTHPISMSFRRISLLSNSFMIASWPGFKSDNFIIKNSYKAKFTELHFLTNFEIMPIKGKKNIHFFFDGIRPTLPNRKKLKDFLIFLFASEGVKLDSLNVIFSTDKTVYNINKKFLRHDFFTDIVTFSLAGTGDPIVADVYISIDRVRDNASLQGETFQRELHRVIFHGALHLCGYEDKSKSQTGEMRRKEDHYLSGYFG